MASADHSSLVMIRCGRFARRHRLPTLVAGAGIAFAASFDPRPGDARALAAEAQRRQLGNAVAFNRRFDRGCLRARDIIRAGGIGPVRYVETVQLGYEGKGWFLVPSLGGGGPFTGRATHMADIVPWLIERSPTQVRARVRGG